MTARDSFATTPLAAIALSLCALLGSACSPLTKAPAPVPAPAGPLANFERMIEGEWGMKFTSGTSMFTQWTWGPGKHSIRSQTYGSGAGGEPWRGMRVIYKVGEQEVRTLGISPFARGVSEGTMKFEGDAAEATFDISQRGGNPMVEGLDVRRMKTEWSFTTPDEYRDTLLEDTGRGYLPLNLLEVIRSTPRSALPPSNPASMPAPSERWTHFHRFIERAGDEEVLLVSKLGAAPLRAKLEWIPYAEALLLRTFSAKNDQEPDLLLDATIYHHTKTETFRCLVLTKAGRVFEGDVLLRSESQIDFTIEGTGEGERVPGRGRLELGEKGEVRLKVWSADSGGAPLFDLESPE